MIFQRIRDVQRAAAEDGGGAAQAGGEHQADLRVSGRGGHQGEAGHDQTGVISTFQIENIQTSTNYKQFMLQTN